MLCNRVVLMAGRYLKSPYGPARRIRKSLERHKIIIGFSNGIIGKDAARDELNLRQTINQKTRKKGPKVKCREEAWLHWRLHAQYILASTEISCLTASRQMICPTISDQKYKLGQYQYTLLLTSYQGPRSVFCGCCMTLPSQRRNE